MHALPAGARRATSAWALACLSGLVGCAAGPDYVRPPVDAAPAFKEDAGPWQTAQPQAIDSTHPWWTLYGDRRLDALVEQANRANQTLVAAAAQYRQARAAVDVAAAAALPTVGVAAGGGRALSNSNGVHLGNDVNLALDAGWEPDLWGGVKRAVEAGNAAAAASADDLAAARLSVQALLAQDYFLLQSLDRQIALYESTVAAYARALTLTQHQQTAGVALRSDVANAETQLQSADAQRIDLVLQRAQLEHAIAILTGQAPATFSLAAATDDAAPLPLLPAGLPSELLQRRPDIAGAERRAAQANANIGVARAAYYPSLSLSGALGYNGTDPRHLFEAPARVWSLGLGLAAALFDGGLRKARDTQAVAAWDQAVAQYRQTVLGAFQEVEDNLAAQRLLAQETAVQDRAVASAQLAERLALDQYRGGTATYLAVVVAQTQALANERLAVQLRGRQRLASVALIKATGGGWDAAAAPDATLARTP
jgi:NodT family efflux transporter outer membrane factor (OMF) lipoprotein